MINYLYRPLDRIRNCEGGEGLRYNRQRLGWLGVLLVVVALVAVGCGPATAEPDPELNPEGDETLEETGFLAPLTGERVEDEALATRRPVAVILGNDNPAKSPQTGLDQAAWVIELPVEGGLTRLMAVFQHRDAPILGPVRSARPVFLDRSLEFGGVLGHVGYSPLAKQEIPKLGVTSLNEFGFSGLYWRVKEKRAPHNLYTDTSRLFGEIKSQGKDEHEPKWELVFLKPEEQPHGSPAENIRIHYPLGVVEYRYNGEKGAYERYYKGQAHVDEESGQQLLATNIIIQEVKRPRVVDSEGRLDVQTIGTGLAEVFQLGQGLEASWRKQARDSWTAFVGADGKPVPLAVGNTWVQMVAEGTKIEIE